MKDHYEIDVTTDDIANGVRAKSCECAIARALKRITQHSVEIEESDQITIGHHKFFAFGADAKRVDEFIHLFDKGQPVQPFGFEIFAKEEEE